MRREKFWLLYQPTVTVGGKDGIGRKVLKNLGKAKKALEYSGESESVERRKAVTVLQCSSIFLTFSKMLLRNFLEMFLKPFYCYTATYSLLKT